MNDAGVNSEEALRSARHKSVAAQCPYIMRIQQDGKVSSFGAGLMSVILGGCFVTRHGCGMRISRGKGMTSGIIVTCHISFIVSE